MDIYDSQTRSTLKEENLILVSKGIDEIIVVTENNKLERWIRNDCFAGFVLSLWGANYEFVESLGYISRQEREDLRN